MLLQGPSPQLLHGLLLQLLLLLVLPAVQQPGGGWGHWDTWQQ
jgi:hypothetical protein